MAKMFKTAHLASVAGAAISLAAFHPAFAQTTQTAREPQDEITSAEDTVVITGIGYRDRAEETAPILVYGADYIQPFEPLTVGDALKRVPSVTFLSDVLESDGVRLRGLDPAYTQILINGEKVPGAGSGSGSFGNGSDGAFFVDRIPAELIDSIEIVRSNSANRSGDAMAGAVNIVLKDAHSLDGGYVRLGALGFDDGRVRETYGAVWGGAVGGGRMLLGANVQGRRNPKEKLSLRYSSPTDTTIDNYEVQTDTRDGTDYSFNGSYQMEIGTSELELSAFYVHTDRTQDEDSFEYNGPAQNEALSSLLLYNNNDVEITQDSYTFNGRYTFDAFGGETSLKAGFASFEDDTFEFEEEVEYLRDATPFPDGDRYTGDAARLDVKDTELSAKLEHERDLSADMQLAFGVQFEQKERDNLVEEATRIRFNLTPGTSFPTTGTRPFTGFAPITGGDNSVEQTRIDPYLMLSGDAGQFWWYAGVRYETTALSVNDRTTLTTTDADYGVVLPSAHISYDLTDADRIRGSVARTIRRPSFSFLSPATLEEELADNDFQGDPTIEPETAWGIDVGYEKRLGRTGIAGVNVFYRDVKDLIEIFNTGVEGSAGPGTFVYAPRNTGDGKVWGIEFDYSASLDFVGLPDTGAFFNYSLLDSEVTDEFGERRFNDQSGYVYNIGFIHDLTQWDASFGVTYRKQGDAFSRVVGEEVSTSYEGVLEVFVEKSLGDNFTVRLTGGNLTDGSKDEVFDKFVSRAGQTSRAPAGYDEYEIESENAGPTWQLIGRYSF